MKSKIRFDITSEKSYGGNDSNRMNKETKLYRFSIMLVVIARIVFPQTCPRCSDAVSSTSVLEL